MHRSFLQFIAIGGLALAGCKPQPEIQTYTVPKEETASRPMMSANGGADPALSPTAPVTAGPASPNAGGPSMTATPGMVAQVSGFATPQWQAPSSWQAKDPGQVRKGSWDIPGDDGSIADMSVTVFPGDVGGDLANINRWRNQLGLPPVEEADLNQLMQHVDLSGGHAHVVFLESADGQAILGAILPQGNGTWFFKMQGPRSVVANQRQPFSDFLQTIQFSAR